MTHVQIYDTTLRDGAQGEGVNFSLQDKLLIARRLDEFGFDFIEGGYPLSNPKDAEFFQRMAAEPLRNSRLCAFGMTRRRGVKAGDDPGMKALIASQAPVVTIVGKTHDFHVTDVLRVSLEENLAMIRESVAFVREAGREVIYDAEHFFDGWKANPEYARQDDPRGSGRRRNDGRDVRHQRRQHARGSGRAHQGSGRRCRTCRWASTPTTIAIWPWPIRSPPSTPGPSTCRARSTASANAAAMPTWCR